MPPIASPWDPEDVLNLGRVSAGVRCVGDIKSRPHRQYRNPIAATNYQRASNLIFRLSRLDPSSSEVNDALDLLARLLLCKIPGHQDQVGIVVAKWRSQIQQFQVVAAARREGPVELEDNARLEHDAPDQRTRNFQQTTLIYAREVEDARQDARLARREVATARQDIAIALQNVETARRNTAIALQDAAVARREAELARREAETARREIRALRYEAALKLEVREALAEQVLALRAARDRAPTRSHGQT